MANNERLVIDERSRNIGNFTVGRLLPFRKRRSVGPFIFIDHMGPTTLVSPHWMDVDQHPHIGLCTFTYLLNGQIEHRDSTGATQIISPGDVGLMTGGRGVSHTERTPKAIRSSDSHFIHGYQIWIALPVDKEEIEPRFDFLPSAQIPQWTADHMTCRLLAGKAMGRSSPLPVHSELFAVDIKVEEDTFLDIRRHFSGEIAVLINEGSIDIDGQTIKAGQLLASDTSLECGLQLNKGNRILLFGGPAFPEPRYLYWNFASSSKERLEIAKQNWQANKFPKVLDDDTYIPLPSY